MVNCSHCGVEMKREVFCTPSHKVMFNRKSGKSKAEIEKGSPEKVVTPEVVEKVVVRPPTTPQSAFRKKACPKHKIFTCGCKENGLE